MGKITEVHRGATPPLTPLPRRGRSAGLRGEVGASLAEHRVCRVLRFVSPCLAAWLATHGPTTSTLLAAGRVHPLKTCCFLYLP